MGTILLFIAKLLQWLLTPIFTIYAIFSLLRVKKWKSIPILDFKLLHAHFGVVAFGIDQLGNITGSPMMNDLLLKDRSIYPYGNPDFTISHVTGVNHSKNNLKPIGKFVVWCLNTAEKDHVQKAAQNEQ